MKKAIFYITTFFLFSYSLYGQTTQSILSVDYDVQQIQDDIIDPLEGLDESILVIDSSLLNDPILQNDPTIIAAKTELLTHQNDINGLISIRVLLSDTLDVNEVYFKIGRVANNDDVINSHVNLNINIGSYRQVLNQITIDLGAYKQIDNLYGEFYIKDAAGNSSSVLLKEFHL